MTDDRGDPLGAMRGLVNGLALSLVLWACILFGLTLLVRWIRP